MPFGELLRRLRGSRAQREVAAELNMPVTTLSTLENQEATPRGAVLKTLSDYYGVPMSYFYSATTSRFQSHDAAREWLLSVKKQSVTKNEIATQAPPEYPEDVKQRFAEKIRQKKRAETSHKQ